MILDKDGLRRAFEKYMLEIYQERVRFDINDFTDFAVTLLNYQINLQFLDPQEKAEAAYYLVTLYNKGMGNRIPEMDLQTIVELISQDYSLDFQILLKITG